MTPQRFTIATVIAVLVATAAFGSAFAWQPTSSANTAAQTDGTSDPVLLEGGDIYWEQEELTVAADGAIELVNIGAAAHNFAIEGYNEDEPVDMPIGGEPVIWEIPDDLAPGEYEFICTIPGHAAAGMVGTLTITEVSEAVGTPEGTPGATPEGTPMNGTPAAGGTEGETVLLEGGDIFWEPEELTVSIGDTIELVNIGAAGHNFAIEGYNEDNPVDMPIGGEPVLWEVPDDLEPGTYTFICTIPGHAAAGMVGEITIEE